MPLALKSRSVYFRPIMLFLLISVVFSHGNFRQDEYSQPLQLRRADDYQTREWPSGDIDDSAEPVHLSLLALGALSGDAEADDRAEPPSADSLDRATALRRLGGLINSLQSQARGAKNAAQGLRANTPTTSANLRPLLRQVPSRAP